MTFDPTVGQWRGATTYLVAGPGSQHPDTSDSIKLWTAPRDGTVTVSASGKVRKEQSGGDGVYVSVVKESGATHSNVWSPTLIAGSDTTGVNEPVTSVYLLTGESLLFRVNQNSSVATDSTVWDPQLVFDPDT